MQVVFHVGMGKTGTTSIQHALDDNRDVLRTQDVEYMGSWFPMLKPALTEPNQLRRFRNETPERIAEYGEQFARYLTTQSDKHGTKLFILSNEGLAGYSITFPPFAAAVSKVAQVRIIAYARNVWTWLPSAYAQWGMRHKTQNEKIRSFRDHSSELAETYMQPVNWSHYLGDLYELRSYDAAENVVSDFADAIGIKLPKSDHRYLQRSEQSELLLRALFNDLHNEPVGAGKFSKAVMNNTGNVLELDEYVSRYFNFGAMGDAVRKHKETFDKIEERFGIDLTANPEKRPKRPSTDKMRERLFDLLMRITLDQSKRIDDLQRQVHELRRQQESNE